jgi:predicted transposase/invertase (TIGR01784 family)
LEYQDVRDAVDYAREEASEKSFKKGIEKGIEKGDELGFKRGINLIARKCFQKGMSLEEVAELLDLDAEQLKELFE